MMMMEENEKIIEKTRNDVELNWFISEMIFFLHVMTQIVGKFFIPLNLIFSLNLKLFAAVINKTFFNSYKNVVNNFSFHITSIFK